MSEWTSNEKTKNAILVGSVFVCGMAVMVFELAGSRIMVPYFGGSIYIWTAIIGVIMGSLSLGYWLGGKMADKNPSPEKYSRVILASAAAVFWTLLVKNGALGFFQKLGLSLEWNALFAALFLFAPASVLLGIVSPYAVRLKLQHPEKAASTVGNLYAASTVGSIFGTFAAGYFLIPFLGTDYILLVLFAILAMTSLFFSKRFFAATVAALAVLTGCFLLINAAKNMADRSAGLVSLETRYNSIKIFPDTQNETKRPILSLSFDFSSRQSSMYMTGDDLVWDYTKYYRLATHFNPDIKKTLMLGGGAYSYPKDFLRQYPSAAMDVVEIDPGVTAAAKKYFRLPDDPRLVTDNEDARVFLNATKNKYDVIYDDAFSSALSVPFQLATSEAVRRQYDALNGNGAVIANVIGSIDGPSGRFFRAEYATFKSVFPQVYVFPVGSPDDANQRQNIILVALKNPQAASMTDPDQELNGYLRHEWKGPIAADVPVLTDDYAPVEYYSKTAI